MRMKTSETTRVLLLVLLLSSQFLGSLAIVQGDIDSGNQYGQVTSIMYYAWLTGTLPGRQLLACTACLSTTSAEIALHPS